MATWKYSAEARIIDRQSIASAASTAVVPVFTEIRAVDATQGEATFKYLPGCASTATTTAVGTLVTFQQTASGAASTAATTNTANQGRPVAVVMAKVLSGQYGWFQIVGQATIKKAAVKVSPGSKIFQSSTKGRITGAAASGKQLLNVVATPKATVASATSTVTVEINRPFLQGQVI